MALDRQSIEKKDFPIGRRGYDPAAVDTHLSRLAEEVDELRRTARKRSESLASAASEQVRAIVEAAETSAAEIQRQAEDEARDIRAEASTEARATREQATEQARDYVGKVSESTSSMLERIDAMESELGALIESLRTGSNRLTADLKLLESSLTEVKDAVVPRPEFQPEAAAQATAAETALDERDLFEEQADQEEAEAEALDGGEDLELAAEDAPAPDVVAAEAGNGADETEGARLIALNMALNGTPREETDRYLAENFQLEDRGGLLDEVYASVEG